MSRNGKLNGFDRKDSRAFGRTASMNRGRADAILDEVITAVSRWAESANEAGVYAVLADEARRYRRLKLG